MSMPWFEPIILALAGVTTLLVPIAVSAVILWLISVVLAPVIPDWASGAIRSAMRRVLFVLVWVALVTHGVVACSS